jgi:hypothetical protein
VVHQHLGVLVGQLAGEGDLVALPQAHFADVLQAEHADHLAADADGGVEHGADALRAQVGLGQLAGARVLQDVVGVDGAAAVDGLQVVGVAAGVEAARQLELVDVAAVDGDRLHMVVGGQTPDAGAGHVVGLAGGLGDQLRGFQQRVAGLIAVPRQAHDQVLLGARAHQVLQVLVLGALVHLQGHLQAQVLFRQLALGFLAGAFLVLQQVAVEQLAAALLEGLADFQQVQHAAGRVQGVAHLVVGMFHQLLLDLFVQAVPRLGFHQAGVGGVEQAASRNSRVQLGSFNRSKRSSPSRDGTGSWVTASTAGRLAVSG